MVLTAGGIQGWNLLWESGSPSIGRIVAPLSSTLLALGIEAPGTCSAHLLPQLPGVALEGLTYSHSIHELQWRVGNRGRGRCDTAFQGQIRDPWAILKVAKEAIAVFPLGVGGRGTNETQAVNSIEPPSRQPAPHQALAGP